MINKFQKLLYALSIITPIPLLTSIIYSIREWAFSTKTVSIIVISILIVAYHYYFLWYSKRNLARIDFYPDTIPEEADKVVFEVSATYVIPFLDCILKNTNKFINIWGLSIVACVILVLFIITTNNTIPSPWYRLIGYHYHKIESVGKKYTIMSKSKNYRNSKNIKGVKRLFEDFLIIVK